jgi:hypothetical protein
LSATTDHLNAIIDAYIITDEFIDNIFHGLPTWDFFWNRRETLQGTNLIDWTFYLTESQMGQTITAFADYMVKPESFALRASLVWADYGFPVMLSSREILKAAGNETRIIKMVEETVGRSRKSARSMLSQDLFSAGLSYAHPLFAGKVVVPMQGLDGIIAADRTYAGFDSTTYTQLDGLVVTISPTAGQMDDMWTSTSPDFLPYAMEEVLDETNYDVGESIDYITTTRIMRSALKRAGYINVLHLTKDYQSSNDDAWTEKIGYKGVDFEGIPVMVDRDCGGGKMYFINSDTLYLATLEGADMAWKEFQDNTDSDAVIGRFDLSCQVICTEPRKQGKITGGSTTRTFT